MASYSPSAPALASAATLPGGQPGPVDERGQAGLSSTTQSRPARAPISAIAGARAERSETRGAVEAAAPLCDGGYGEAACAVATRAVRGVACAESAGRPLPAAELSQEQELRRQKEEQEKQREDNEKEEKKETSIVNIK